MKQLFLDLWQTGLGLCSPIPTNQNTKPDEGCSTRPGRLQGLSSTRRRAIQIGGAARSVMSILEVTRSRWIMYRPAPMMMAMPIRLSVSGKSLKTR